MVHFPDIFIFHMTFVLAGIIEQICFTIFTKYPYRYGVPIVKAQFMLPDLSNLTTIEEQFRFIAQHLSESEDYECKVLSRSEEIYIRGKHKYLITDTGLRFIGASVFFKDGWHITIRVGVLTCLTVIYISTVSCVLGTAPAIVIVICVAFFLIRSQISEYYKLRRFLSNQLGALK